MDEVKSRGHQPAFILFTDSKGHCIWCELEQAPCRTVPFSQNRTDLLCSNSANPHVKLKTVFLIHINPFKKQKIIIKLKFFF
jgi:hypothetical protein